MKNDELELEHLVEIFKKWDEELSTLNLERFKLEAAMRALGAEINLRQKKADRLSAANEP